MVTKTTVIAGTLTEDVLELIRKLLQNAQIAFASVLSAMCTIFTPAIPIFITAFSFIIADAYYGYKVSSKYGKHKFESNRLWSTVRKLRDAAIIICLFVLLDKYILMTYEDLTSAKIAASTIITAEIVSLLESFRALNPNALLAKILGKVIKSKAEKYLDVDLSDIINIK